MIAFVPEPNILKTEVFDTQNRTKNDHFALNNNHSLNLNDTILLRFFFFTILSVLKICQFDV
jgi:hypothetical protein